MVKALTTFAIAALFSPVAAWGKVDLVTLPGRDRVQITIYNSADLTLVRDARTLTLREGTNRLQFSWANTLIDPTSLELVPGAGGYDVMDLVYPPRVGDMGIWHVEAERPGSLPVEISYFTSGVSWGAYYLATLAPDEGAMELRGYVRVQNASGEDYEGAETRLVVGRINLLDRIAELARRRPPYGRPSPYPVAQDRVFEGAAAPAPMMRAAKAELAMEAPKEIRKEGLSEYFLYTIEGTEDIPDGWGKRLMSFEAAAVPVRNLYRFEEERYGALPVRFLEFANDAAHNLGKEPIPGGLVKVFRRIDPRGLSYVGAQNTRYVPKGEEVTLNLGPADDVTVKPTLMGLATDNYEWKRDGKTENDEVTGWDEHHTFKVEVANHRDIPVRIEVRRNFPVTAWELDNEGDVGEFETVDADTVQYTLELPPHASREFRYRLTLHLGSRGL